jgi:hypothetical protein
MAKTMPKKEPVFGACSHINRQSYGIDNKPSNLSCELPEGHEGPHQARYERLEKTSMHGVDELAGHKVIKVGTETFIAVPDVTTWEDIAGEYPAPVDVPIDPA